MRIRSTYGAMLVMPPFFIVCELLPPFPSFASLTPSPRRRLGRAEGDSSILAHHRALRPRNSDDLDLYFLLLLLLATQLTGCSRFLNPGVPRGFERRPKLQCRRLQLALSRCARCTSSSLRSSWDLADLVLAAGYRFPVC